MDYIAPTLERARHAGDTWEPLHHDKRAGTVKPARQVSRFEASFTAGRIDAEEAAAGLKFERHREMATRVTVTGSYGTRGAEGTPAGQLANDDDAARSIDWYMLHKEATHFIGRGNAEWLGQFIEGVPLYDLGGGGKKANALHRAQARLRHILGDLAVYYGILRPPER